MPDAASSAPVAASPGWIRPARRAPAFWLPTAILFGMTLLLLLVWPRRLHHRAPNGNLPEPSAAYVLLEGYRSVPGPIPPGPPVDILGRDFTARRLPAAEYTGVGDLEPWMPALLALPPSAPPSLAARPVADVLSGAPLAATNTLAATLSAGLERCAFRFEIPAGVATGMPAVARFQVELDDHGEVVHLLADPCDNPAAARLLEAAVSRGRGTGPGRGQVTVAWGK
jgi:hypothetical protein